MDVVLPPVADPVGEALHFLRMSGIFYCRSEFTAPWALELPPINHSLMLHAVTEGQCWLEVAGSPRRLLHKGDLGIIPHGSGHLMYSTPGLRASRLFDIPREQISERYENLRLGGGGEPASVICSLFQYEDPAAGHLVRLLPGLIAVPGWNAPYGEWVHSTLRLMASEACEIKPGGETLIPRLADILVIQAIRFWIEQDPVAQTGWLGALRDPQIGRALIRIHREPQREWTLESLAGEAAMSRSAFAARFVELVGEPAMRYVTRWRMMTALRWLREGSSTVGEVARRLSYESEAAFSRAFKRMLGVTPGAARRTGIAAGLAPELQSRATAPS